MNKSASVNYCHGYAKQQDNKINKYEKSDLVDLPETHELIIRLDGKGITKHFKSKLELFSVAFHCAMRRTVAAIQKYFPYIRFIYSAKDELSILIDRRIFQDDDYLSESKQIRVEKILPIIAGYVSAIFSQYIPQCLKKIENEFFSFDARAIVVPKEKLMDYFHTRQAYAITAAVCRMSSFYKLPIKYPAYNEFNNYIRKNDVKIQSCPRYVSHGYVFYFNHKKERITEEADEFYQLWHKYARYI